MKKTKLIKVAATTKEVLDFIKCDLCDRKGYNENDWGELYRTDQVEISLRKGEVYPESSWGDTIEYHICPDCFKDKLMVWMDEQGAIATKSEWGY